MGGVVHPEQAVWADTLPAGSELPGAQFGPVTIQDTVAWAGVQENPWRLHFDREYVREHYGLDTFIASGQYRQALLMRWLVEWAGPSGVVRRLAVRQMRPTFEGDLVRFAGTVTDSSIVEGLAQVTCEIVGSNQDDAQVLAAEATIVLPRRAAP